MNATEMQEMTDHAEKIKNDGEHVIQVMSPGDMWCQGDVGIIFLGECGNHEDVDFGKLELLKDDDPRRIAQLAPGETQGSRHCIDAECMKSVKMYVKTNSFSELDGPRLVCPEGLRVNHPEHGDVTMPPGKYAVVYQQVWDSMRARRALD